MSTRNSQRLIVATTIALSLLLPAAAHAQESPARQKSERTAASDPAPVEPSKLGTIYNVHRCGNFWMAGQPQPEHLELLTREGIECVVTFRTEEEVDWDEQAAIEGAGMEFRAIRYGTVESLTDEIFDASRKLMREKQGQPILLHCGAAVRVAAVWLTYRVLDEGVDLEQAVAEAQKIGLRSKALRERALQYIKDQKR